MKKLATILLLLMFLSCEQETDEGCYVYVHIQTSALDPMQIVAEFNNGFTEVVNVEDALKGYAKVEMKDENGSLLIKEHDGDKYTYDFDDLYCGKKVDI